MMNIRLSAGALAGIVIGCIIAGSVLVASIVHLIRRKKTKTEQENRLVKSCCLHICPSDPSWHATKLLESAMNNLDVQSDTRFREIWPPFYSHLLAYMAAYCEAIDLVPCNIDFVKEVAGDSEDWADLLFNEKRKNHFRKSALMHIAARFLMSRLDPDVGLDITLLPPELSVMRKKVMASTWMNAFVQAYQHFWSFLTVHYAWKDLVSHKMYPKPFDPSDPRSINCDKLKEDFDAFMAPFARKRVEGYGKRLFTDEEADNNLKRHWKSMKPMLIDLAVLLISTKTPCEVWWPTPEELPWPKWTNPPAYKGDRFIVEMPGLRVLKELPGSIYFGTKAVPKEEIERKVYIEPEYSFVSFGGVQNQGNRPIITPYGYS